MMTQDELNQLDLKGITAWDTHDTEAFVGLLSDDFVWVDDTVPEPMRTRDQAREYMSRWFTAFPDMRARETNRVLGEDSLAAEVEFTGTNTGPLRMGGREIAATGKPLSGHGAYFVRARDGKIVEFHSHADVAGMLSQLGVLTS